VGQLAKNVIRSTLTEFSESARDRFIAENPARVAQEVQYLSAAIIQSWDLQAVLNRSVAPFAFTATRAQDSSHPLYAAMSGMSAGDIFSNAGFESSSIDIANEWNNRDVAVDYRIPAGAHGAYLNGVPGNNAVVGVQNEVEWLIPAGGTWTVSAKTTDPVTGKIHVTLDLIGQRDPFTGASIWP
jgi:hypothetical protein